MTDYKAKIDSFGAHAHRFCAWCDADKTALSPARWQFEALDALAGLYAAALGLPDAEFAEAPEPERPSKEKLEAIGQRFATLPFQLYWEIFTPSQLEASQQPVCGDLVDDFLDIYADLSEGLWLYDRGHEQGAVFSWRFSFGIHWGRHAVSALHALHSYEPPDE